MCKWVCRERYGKKVENGVFSSKSLWKCRVFFSSFAGWRGGNEGWL